ncbi:MAG: ribosome small subunit-dependent GTPase A [Lachnospiraceae bacterium]|nr:ribosome small subunit-dependent GTPase A [Lachnospiraceae bacterium]
MQGIIVKGIAGFYYVRCTDGIVYECKAKGVFRKDHKKPLVGDLVSMDVLDQDKSLGHISEIKDRKNELIRPAVANIDQAMVIFAAAHPMPNLGLLDRFLIQMEHYNIPTIICFNKADLVSNADLEYLQQIYEKAGYRTVLISAKKGQGIDLVRELLRGKVTTVAGPSGVGKSTLINLLQDRVIMETGSVSEKIARGKHTTRHSELLEIDRDTFIFDTPGFSSLDVSYLLPEELENCFPEMRRYRDKCRFLGCAHIHEPDCGVKQALTLGEMSKERYDDYVNLYAECKNKRRY